GASLPASSSGAPPDHIATELSFIAFLFAKEAHAHFAGDAAAVEICQQGRTAFLREHLGMWVGSFASTVAVRAPDTFYAQAAVLTAEAVREMVKGQGSIVNALPLVNQQPSTVDDDACFACPAACGSDEEEWA
ncbi:MAG: molecular chaperone TorD family protein, partial [Abditibacteriales bacterium]|nr:molecular chaperone TorD family protein [Abditibacteriales bacterium]MDW8366479.1 molecular chaperone TorD family protein [Abditibacteriales bacterium]